MTTMDEARAASAERPELAAALDLGARLARVRHLVTIETNRQARAKAAVGILFVCANRNQHKTHNYLILYDNM